MKKEIPFNSKIIEKIKKEHGTPFYLYDERGIKSAARDLNEAFSWNKGFKEFYAVKANPNPRILEILKKESCGADASSLAELIVADRAGVRGESIMFSSNNTPAGEFKKAKELGAIINLDDISHISYLEEYVGIPDIISFRYNPGVLRESGGNEIIGTPKEAKFGLTKEQIFEAYETMRDKGVSRFGIHTMVVSNELDTKQFMYTAEMMFELVADLSRELNIDFEFVNLGGGLGIPYHPEQEEINLNAVSASVKKAYEKHIEGNNLPDLKIFMENGRYITGPYGYLVASVRHIKHTHKDFVGLDASMSDLMRPGMYGAYHHITVLEKDGEDTIYDVTGSLCENNDKFAIDRNLPKLERGDVLIIHDAGAHGHAMGFNYNGKLRPAEFLLAENGTVEMIRRAETLEDYFNTLEF
ncbi:MAG: diaminopimelate decarboxylase [Candidatus Spechtbacterales bacterium]|nr:diaminopimelate decarboxylase [Candidatus Spechtbacterales bacterium]